MVSVVAAFLTDDNGRFVAEVEVSNGNENAPGPRYVGRERGTG